MEDNKTERKTLVDFVVGLPDDQIFKVGCVEGSSYVFACKKPDFLEEVEIANHDQKQTLRKKYNNACSDLRHLLDGFPSMKSFAENLISRQEDDVSEFSFSGYMRFCNDWLQNVYIANGRVKSTKKARQDFIPFEDRLVDRTFMSDPVIGNELIVMIDGSGHGKFWDYSEALAEKEKREKHERDTVDGETQEEGE